ncbi:MAG: GntR family transcriptional regulator [Chloroflexota bacterium]|nr:GntR family transcriptional regulator [Chloroflexota bacterium]
MAEDHIGQRLGPQQARVYLAIRSAIDSGQFRPGQLLGSQAELAHQHGVALGTLHQALRALEQDGYIVRRHGVGTFVASDPPASASPLRALARFSMQSFPSAEHAIDAALALLGEQIGVRSAFLSRFDGDQLAIVGDYDRGGCGIKAGSSFPVDDAF